MPEDIIWVSNVSVLVVGQGGLEIALRGRTVAYSHQSRCKQMLRPYAMRLVVIFIEQHALCAAADMEHDRRSSNVRRLSNG